MHLVEQSNIHINFQFTPNPMNNVALNTSKYYCSMPNLINHIGPSNYQYPGFQQGTFIISTGVNNQNSSQTYNIINSDASHVSNPKNIGTDNECYVNYIRVDHEINYEEEYNNNNKGIYIDTYNVPRITTIIWEDKKNCLLSRNCQWHHCFQLC